MNYKDRRFSFGVVVYGSNGKILKQIEVKGSRHIYHIVLNSASDAAFLFGQSANSIAVPLSRFNCMEFLCLEFEKV